jgi:hypothetical protein
VPSVATLAATIPPRFRAEAAPAKPATSVAATHSAAAAIAPPTGATTSFASAIAPAAFTAAPIATTASLAT